MQYDDNAEKYGYEGEMTPMKCDGLKSIYIDRTGDWCRSGNNTGKFYLKEEADAAIAELKAEIGRKEGVEQRWFERCMAERTENIRLKRALWLARLRTLMNFSVLAYFQILRAKGKKSNMDFNEMAYRINLACVKCRAKAEEYK